jgi:Uma2 family endonuclease
LLIPDIAVVETAAAEREDVSASPSMRPEDIFLAVEVISPSSRKSDLHKKKQFYTDWKIGSYWLLDRGFSRSTNSDGGSVRTAGSPT